MRAVPQTEVTNTMFRRGPPNDRDVPEPMDERPSMARESRPPLTRLVGAVLQWLPAEWSAALEYRFQPSAREPYGGPLNGQLVRQRIVLELLRLLPLQAIVETGSFRGSTTEFFATHSRAPVFTVELSPRLFHYSRLRLRGLRQVHIALGDSRRFLQALAGDSRFPKQSVFFYLDAHRYDDLPLREEVELILRCWKQAVIMIDDFEVPGDSGYAFDDYGPGKRLCLQYLSPLSSLGVVAFFPAVPSRQETGHKRGCVVLVDSAIADHVTNISLLRVDNSASISSDSRG